MMKSWPKTIAVYASCAQPHLRCEPAAWSISAIRQGRVCRVALGSNTQATVVRNTSYGVHVVPLDDWLQNREYGMLRAIHIYIEREGRYATCSTGIAHLPGRWRGGL
jgi:hypothetical protein